MLEENKAYYGYPPAEEPVQIAAKWLSRCCSTGTDEVEPINNNETVRKMRQPMPRLSSQPFAPGLPADKVAAETTDT